MWNSMPRASRKASATGVYHVMVRGINRQDIFHDKEDFIRYLESLRKAMLGSNSRLLGYCLMSNHAHLLIAAGPSGISEIIKRLGIGYALWYNLKNDRCGHVFQDRFKSEAVEDDQYLQTVIRYIHQNPVKAGIVNKPEGYAWSSCKSYYGEIEHPPGLTHTQLILSLFADTPEKAVKAFRRFMDEANQDECLEDLQPKRMTDARAGQIITELLQGKPMDVLHKMSKSERDQIVRDLKFKEGLGIRQISRITGLGYQIVYMA